VTLSSTSPANDGKRLPGDTILVVPLVVVVLFVLLFMSEER